MAASSGPGLPPCWRVGGAEAGRSRAAGAWRALSSSEPTPPSRAASSSASPPCAPAPVLRLSRGAGAGAGLGSCEPRREGPRDCSEEGEAERGSESACSHMPRDSQVGA
jgi:hypothetical protein